MLLFVSYALDIYLYYVQGVGRSGFCGGGLSVAGWASGAGPVIGQLCGVRVGSAVSVCPVSAC